MLKPLKKIVTVPMKGLERVLDIYAKNELKLMEMHRKTETYDIFIQQRANQAAGIDSMY